jgi:D-xylulose reductase
VFVGCPSHPTPLSVADMQVRELRTESIFRYANVYPKAIALLESGSIDLKPIITNAYDFEEAVEAFDFMRNPPPETIKTVIRLNHDQ